MGRLVSPAHKKPKRSSSNPHPVISLKRKLLACFPAAHGKIIKYIKSVVSSLNSLYTEICICYRKFEGMSKFEKDEDGQPSLMLQSNLMACSGGNASSNPCCGAVGEWQGQGKNQPSSQAGGLLIFWHWYHGFVKSLQAVNAVLMRDSKGRNLKALWKTENPFLNTSPANGGDGSVFTGPGCLCGKAEMSWRWQHE